MLESEVLGTATNSILPGQNVVPVYEVNGLEACTLGSLYIPGAEEETDDDLRSRWQEKKTGPAQNNNRSQYKVWCEERAGVGRAHILPLYGGENTVKAVIYSTEGGIPAKSILEDVQSYIDPIVEGYQVTVNGKALTFSDGLGDGVSDLGAHFLAAAPEAVAISVSFSADLKSGYSKQTAQTEVQNAIKTYFKTLVVDGDEDITVRVSSIGSLIASAESILDYVPASLKLNGSTENVKVGKESTPVLKEVLIDA